MATTIDDEMMPQAPVAEGEAAATIDINVTLDGQLFDDVPKMGEAFPPGTYHFRLDGYSVGLSELEDNTWGFEKQPYFLITWVAQQEPVTGRNFREFCPYVDAKLAEAARGDKAHPKTQAARKILNDRLWKAKAILEGAEYKPGANFDFRAFLDSHPEMKITTGLKDRKEKQVVVDSATGQPAIDEKTGQPKQGYVPTGEKDTKAVKYMPLRAPAR